MSASPQSVPLVNAPVNVNPQGGEFDILIFPGVKFPTLGNCPYVKCPQGGNTTASQMSPPYKLMPNVKFPYYQKNHWLYMI